MLLNAFVIQFHTIFQFAFHLGILQSARWCFKYAYNKVNSCMIHKTYTLSCHYGTLNSFTALNSPICFGYSVLVSSQNPGDHCHFYCFYSFTFSKTSYKWNHAMYSLSGWLSQPSNMFYRFIHFICLSS
jgi:hypothetical protein